VIEELIVSTAALDARRFGTRGFSIWMEQEGGASGPTVMAHYAHVLAGYEFHADKKDVHTDVRARPMSSQMEAGNIDLVDHPSLVDFIDEMEAYGQEGVHDDMIAAATGAFLKLQVSAAPYIAAPGASLSGSRGSAGPSWISANYGD